MKVLMPCSVLPSTLLGESVVSAAPNLPLSNPFPVQKPGVHQAPITASPRTAEISHQTTHIPYVLRPRADKTKSPAIAGFDGFSVSVFPPNWCGFVNGEPGRFVTCPSTETCALASSHVCCASKGVCSNPISACTTRLDGVQSHSAVNDGTLYCDGSVSPCQTLSYGSHASFLRCAEEPGTANLLPVTNLLSSYSGLKVSYGHDKEKQDFTFHGIYDQSSATNTEGRKATATSPVEVHEYLTNLGVDPPLCADDMNKSCATSFAEVQRFWNTTEPRNWYCGEVISSPCEDLCRNDSTSARDFINWNNRVCEEYFNTYDPIDRKQEFLEEWSQASSLGDVAYLGLFPWTWQVRNESDKAATTHNSCASPSAELGSFAVVNVIVLLVAVLLSRRSFVSRITCGRLGSLGSSLWILSGFLSFIFSIIANLTNAILLRNEAGYGHVPIGGLILLWASRPRLAWIVILLVNFRSSNSEYLGSAASAALAETLQQLLGLVYIGRTANFARANGLLSGSKIAHVPRSHYALLMYRGSIVILVFVSFAVFTILIIMRSMRNELLTLLGLRKREVSQQTEIPLHSPRAAEGISEAVPGTDPTTATTLKKMRLEHDHVALIYRMAFYMLPILIGQWIFWAGFINLSGNRYCPPSIWRMTGVWGALSSLGLLFGAGS